MMFPFPAAAVRQRRWDRGGSPCAAVFELNR